MKRNIKTSFEINFKASLVLLCLFVLVITVNGRAEDEDDVQLNLNKNDESLLLDSSNGKRQKYIEFEEGFIDSVNKGKGDLATLLTKDKQRDGEHLYQKFLNFRPEMGETIREMRFGE